MCFVKMPYYCTVPRCTSMAGKAKNVSFHQFPRDEELAKLWNKILKRGKPYTKYSKVCSLHFRPEDYTITSVGKNKGQWRTLRKDAIPSQNLPSDSPVPQQRRHSDVWVPNNVPTNIMDPQIQQQVAQVIYMQTMLAMQAAGSADARAVSPNCQGPQNSESVQPSGIPHSSVIKSKTEPSSPIHNHTISENTSFKCAECSKCFKDPDVYILHKRTHLKNDTKPKIIVEKENFNVNNSLTLQSNPILANLLKNNQENNIFDINFENHVMTALAVNMENYMRNLSSMMMMKRDDHDDDCDSNLNESLESNKLVIDESV